MVSDDSDFDVFLVSEDNDVNNKENDDQHEDEHEHNDNSNVDDNNDETDNNSNNNTNKDKENKVVNDNNDEYDIDKEQGIKKAYIKPKLNLGLLRDKYGDYSDVMIIENDDKKKKTKHKIYDINENMKHLNDQKKCPISQISLKQLKKEDSYTIPTCKHTYHMKAALQFIKHRIKLKEKCVYIGLRKENQIDLRNDSILQSNIDIIKQSQETYKDIIEGKKNLNLYHDDIRKCLFSSCPQYFPKDFIWCAIDMYFESVIK